MVYFNDNEVKVLKEMIDYCDDYCDDVPRVYSELLGAIRFRVESERVTEEANPPEDGVAE